MIISTLENNTHMETAYICQYMSYTIVVRQITPIQSDLSPWFACYIDKKRDFSEEEIENIPAWCGITYNSVYPYNWVVSPLTNKYVLGWDYHHGVDDEFKKSVKSIIEDAKKLIDYIEDKIC